MTGFVDLPLAGRSERIRLVPALPHDALDYRKYYGQQRLRRVRMPLTPEHIFAQASPPLGDFGETEEIPNVASRRRKGGTWTRS